MIAGVAAIGGCGLFTADDDYCTAEAAPAILLEIVDIATNVSPLVPSRMRSSRRAVRSPANGPLGNFTTS